MYVRPPIDEPRFVDAEGRVIEYGRRWGMDPVPERFAPLHPVEDLESAIFARAWRPWF